MNLGRTSFIFNKNSLKTILFISISGFIISYFIYQNMDKANVLVEIKNISDYLNEKRLNYIIIHFIIISLLLTSSTIGMGIILFPLYFLFEFFCLSFNILSFLEVFKLKGLIFSLLYNGLTKGIYLFLMFLIFRKVLSISKAFIGILLKKWDNNVKYLLTKKLKGILLCIVLIFLNDIFIYFFGNKILLKLLFIIS